VAQHLVPSRITIRGLPTSGQLVCKAAHGAATRVAVAAAAAINEPRLIDRPRLLLLLSTTTHPSTPSLKPQILQNFRIQHTHTQLQRPIHTVYLTADYSELSVGLL